ncbi:MAG: phosphotransferase [Myxococcota bacterium]
MSYRVCIPTAGLGSRLGAVAERRNKSLVSVANKPVLAHVVEQFPETARFVIALGFGGELVREFLEIAYPERAFDFVEIDRYEGPGAGLGYTILCCRPLLEEPFVFCSCDTITTDPIPVPDQNWMAYTKVEDLGAYRTLRIRGGRVEEICEKGVTGDDLRAYIGLAGISDHEAFWKAMEDGRRSGSIEVGESHGMRALLELGVHSFEFRWFDTGNPEALAETRASLSPARGPNLLEKPAESIWFVGGNVIKYAEDTAFIANRVERARLLEGFCPTVEASTRHMYRYRWVEGKVLSELVTLPIFEELLRHSTKFWRSIELDGDGMRRFHEACLAFYRDKTRQRVQLFLDRFGRTDREEQINGIRTPAVRELLQSLDWEWLVDGKPVRFHGDYHFENILLGDDGRLHFLDWRQEFGGSLSVGDLYYDLAKLKHGLLVSHELVLARQFSVQDGPEGVRFELLRRQILVECERRLERFLVESGLDAAKVDVLTALVFLNIAALHDHPYCQLLFHLGRSLLFEATECRGASRLASQEAGCLRPAAPPPEPRPAYGARAVGELA